jgi:hypothetical protein
VPRKPIENPLLDSWGNFDPMNVINPYAYAVAGGGTPVSLMDDFFIIANGQSAGLGDFYTPYKPSPATPFEISQASNGWTGIGWMNPVTISLIKAKPRDSWSSRMTGGTFRVDATAADFSSESTLYTVAVQPTEGVFNEYSVTPTSCTYARYYSPTNGYCNIQSIQYWGTASTTRQKFTGTAIGNSSGYTGATDGNLATYPDGGSADGMWAGLDFGTAKTIDAIRFCPRFAWASRLTGGKVQVSSTSDFSSDVTDLYTFGSGLLDYYYQGAFISGAPSKRYARVLSPNGGYGNIAEIEFWGA